MQLMKNFNFSRQSRRDFFVTTAVSSSALAPIAHAAENDAHLLGPRPGYSPHIGTLVSEMTWMRRAVLGPVKGMTRTQLDFLLDDKANRIGALLFHLAATEKLYQLNTFDSLTGIQKSPAFKDWAVAMELGEPARQVIKGHDLDYYLNLLNEVRAKTLAEFRKRDDEWLFAADKSWSGGPTNNLGKWFHVCEHESHHSGQISMLKSRAPAA